MTNDELLAKVTHGYRWTCDGDREPWDALRAVVELHKPYLYPEDDKIYCFECQVIYPCPTIKAIEKELS